METDYQERVSLPITNELRRGQMEIMRRWMDSDPAIWLKYSDTFFGPYQRELVAKFGADYDAMTDYIWEGSMFSSVEKSQQFTSPQQFAEDRLARFITDVSIQDFNSACNDLNIRNKIHGCNHGYVQALYEMRADKGIAQYPDANSTMRITYGTVGPLEPQDGVWCSWQTSTNGILEKYDPKNRDFKPSDEFMSMLRSRDWGRWAVPMPSASKKSRADSGFSGAPAGTLPVNFLTDNDITGGNSGSPVLNASGQVIGLAFDGNKESLASDLYCTPDYNKCVCVDIRYSLWTLDKYAGMGRILDELGL